MYFNVNRKRVFAATAGKPFRSDRPTVVFLHGSGLDHTFWELHSGYFGCLEYSVLLPDFPGHTHSDGPALASIEELADWLKDVLDAVRATDISVVAHSQGSLVALEYASRYKNNLKSVSFVASGLATPVNTALMEAAENNPEAAIAMMLRWGFGRAGQPDQRSIPENSKLDCSRKVMDGNASGALLNDLRACNAYTNGKSAAANIDCPTQVILAGKDRMAPRKAGLQLVEHLNNPEVHILESCGHMLPLEMPDETREFLENFIYHNNPLP